MINKKGLAQIPLMIGLLIMAIVVPIATKLVQQNQENRGQAACYANYAGCSNNASCCSGYCSGICMPASNPTTKPVATSIPVPSCRTEGQSCASISCCNSGGLFCNSARICVKPATPTLNPCSVSSGKPSNCPCSYNNQCSSGYCSGVCTTPPPPTATPTNDPRQPCGSWRSDECSTGSCTGGNVCINNHSIGSKCVCIAPTATPNPCSITTGRANNCTCTYNNQCASGNCAGSTVCLPMPTVTPKPCSTVGGNCNSQGDCCSGNVCWNGHCYVSSGPSPTPTTKPCSTTGGNCNSQGDCCSGNVCWNGHCYVSSGPSPTPIINPTGTNPTNPPSNKCPGAEACPYSTEPDLLRNCTPADADGTSKDYLCNADMVGKRGPCGGKEYCCPSAGGAWTTDMAKCPVAACTQCAGKPDAKGKGDADCSGSTTLNDASIWRSEFITGKLGTVIKNSWNADFDCDGKVTLEDIIKIWKSNFINGLSNN